MVVKSILRGLWHLLWVVCPQSALSELVVHIWHQVWIHWVSSECLILVEAWNLWLNVVLWQHILHSIHLVGIWVQLPTIAWLVGIWITHSSEIHEVWHIWNIWHGVLKVINAVKIVVTLIHLHIIEPKALWHLIWLSKLRKLLLIGHKVLICILTIIWCPLVLKLLVGVLFLLLLRLWNNLIS